MPSGARGTTREQELEAAIMSADVTPSDFRVYRYLLYIADHGTAVIPPRFQPKSLVKLAEATHISLAGVKRSISHLQRHGWLERARHITDKGIGGRSHPTYYKLNLGRDCDCKGAQREPVPSKKPAQREPINRLTTPRVSAGRAPDSRERAVKGGVGKGDYLGGAVNWDWPADSIGAAVNDH